VILMCVKLYLLVLAGVLAMATSSMQRLNSLASPLYQRIAIPPKSLISRMPGAIVAEVNGIDVVHPTFSPDGKFLAYSKVLVQKGRENTAVYILDLTTQKTTTLIDDKTAEKYRTHSAFVSGMEWSRGNRLSVTISDGDVDSTELIFDPQTKKLVATKFWEGGESFYRRSQDQKKLAQRILPLFPNIDRAVLNQAIQGRQAGLLNDRVLLKGKLFDTEDVFWVLNLRSKSATKLFESGNPLSGAELSNVNAIGNTLFFALATAGTVPQLVRYRDGKIEALGKLTGVSNEHEFKVLHDSGAKVILISRIHATYDRGNNPLYILENGQLRRSNVFGELYDAQVSANGQRIAYCYWAKQGKRQILVRDGIF
jgi:hypothetical protein